MYLNEKSGQECYICLNDRQKLKKTFLSNIFANPNPTIIVSIDKLKQVNRYRPTWKLETDVNYNY